MKILDKHVHKSKYNIFWGCYIRNSRKTIRFIYANGIGYDVPLEYFLTWFYQPHFIFNGKRWIRFNKNKHKVNKKKDAYFVSWRRSLDKQVVRIRLSDNTAYSTPWDTVLMACEPDYEHFGGLVDESKKTVGYFHDSGRRCAKTTGNKLRSSPDV